MATKNKGNWCTDLLVLNKLVNFKIDTGAEVNIITKNVFDSLQTNVNIVHTKTKLTSYTGEKLNVLGKCFLTTNHKGSDHLFEFYIVNTKAPCILRLGASLQLNLIKRVDYDKIHNLSCK